MAKIKKAKEARVNMADKMKYESRLMGNIAEWMMAHGTVKSDRERSNEYTGIRIVKVCWRGQHGKRMILWVTSYQKLCYNYFKIVMTTSIYFCIIFP